MLGHRKTGTSDTDAPLEMGYLTRALEVTEAIISKIEELAPGGIRDHLNIQQISANTPNAEIISF